MEDSELQHRHEALLGDALVDAGKITGEQLDEAVSLQVVMGGHLETNLWDMGLLTHQEADAMGAKVEELPCVSEQELGNIPPHVLAILPKHVVQASRVIPFAVEERTVSVATSEPWHIHELEEAASSTGYSFKTYYISDVHLVQQLHHWYGVPLSLRVRVGPAHVTGKASTTDAPKVEATPSPKTGATKKEGTVVAISEMLSGGSGAPPAAQARQEAGGRPEHAPAAQQVSAKSRPMPPPAPVDAGMPPPPPQDVVAREAPALPTIDLKVDDAVYEIGAPISDLDVAYNILERAGSRDTVAHVFCRFVRSRAKRVVLLAHHKNYWAGWAGTGITHVPELRDLVLPSEPGTIFGTVNDTGAYYLGPLAEHALHTEFIDRIGGGRPRTAALFPIHYHGRPVFAVYWDNGAGKMVKPDVADILMLSQRIPQTLERLIKERLGAR